MARHKKIAYYDGDWKVFSDLRRKGRVLEQYDYSNRKTKAGEVFVAKEAGEEFIAIATNVERRVARHYGNRKKRFNYYRIMFRLTNEGWSYLKGMLLEESIGNHPRS